VSRDVVGHVTIRFRLAISYLFFFQTVYRYKTHCLATIIHTLQTQHCSISATVGPIGLVRTAKNQTSLLPQLKDHRLALGSIQII